MGKKIWTDKNILLLKQQYATHPDLDVLAKEMGVDIGQLRGKASNLKLIRKQPKSRKGTTSSTPAIDAQLTANYLNKTIAAMALLVIKSESFVSNRLGQLGLVQPEEVKERNRALTRFKAGLSVRKKEAKPKAGHSAEAIRIAKEKEDTKRLRQQEKARMAAIREAEVQQAEKRKKRNRPQFKTKTVDLTGKIRVQINPKTHIFCKPGSDIEAIKTKYSTPSTLRHYGNRI